MPRPIAEYVQKFSYYDGHELKRPRSFHLPVPWSQDTSWGTLHNNRSELARAQSRCLLCGEKVTEGYVIVTSRNDSLFGIAGSGRQYRKVDMERVLNHYYPDDLPREDVTDHAPLHERCAKLTMAHCPTLHRAAKGEGAVLVPYSHKRPRSENPCANVGHNDF